MDESNFWSLLRRLCRVFVFSALRNAEVSSGMLSERPGVIASHIILLGFYGFVDIVRGIF